MIKLSGACGISRFRHWDLIPVDVNHLTFVNQRKVMLLCTSVLHNSFETLAKGTILKQLSSSNFICEFSARKLGVLFPFESTNRIFSDFSVNMVKSVKTQNCYLSSCKHFNPAVAGTEGKAGLGSFGARSPCVCAALWLRCWPGDCETVPSHLWLPRAA